MRLKQISCRRLRIFHISSTFIHLTSLMKKPQITVQATIYAPLHHVWQCWTTPAHVMGWNFANSDWHCPAAENNLTIGGEFHYTMAAKDGSVSFDFWGTYLRIEPDTYIELTLGDGRSMSVSFEDRDGETLVTEVFDPEDMNEVELQRAGWQAILNQFKQYTEEALVG